MNFAKWSFRIAGIWGLSILFPTYFLESRLNADFPPPINHPEYFYGFIGVALAWQVAFLIIARDPGKYRLLMIPAVLEKFSYAGAVFALFAAGRVQLLLAASGVTDLLFGIAFVLSFWRTRELGETR